MGFRVEGLVFTCGLLFNSTVGLVSLFLLKLISSSVNSVWGVLIRGSTRNLMVLKPSVDQSPLQTRVKKYCILPQRSVFQTVVGEPNSGSVPEARTSYLLSSPTLLV